MTKYMVFLLSGHTIKNIDIKVGMICGYMGVVNTYFVRNNCIPPFNPRSKSDAAVLLLEQESFENDPA